MPPTPEIAGETQEIGDSCPPAPEITGQTPEFNDPPQYGQGADRNTSILGSVPALLSFPWGSPAPRTPWVGALPPPSPPPPALAGVWGWQLPDPEGLGGGSLPG